jgi:predicted component of type VI protein secretion system
MKVTRREERSTTAPQKRSSFADAFEQAFTQTLAQPTDKPTEQSQVPQVQAQPQIQPQPQPTQQATPTLQAPSLSTFVSAKQPTLESDLGTDTTTTNNNDYTNNVQRFGLQA